MLQTIDFYIWKYLLPRFTSRTFKSGFVSFLAFSYISLFSLPRKFFFHFLHGSGECMTVDTMQVLTHNPEVMEFIQNKITSNKNNTGGSIPVSQLLVTHPNHKYSLGSFELVYTIKENNLLLSLHGNYHYAKDPDRITRHLHNSMHTLSNLGKAANFEVKGRSWETSMNEISSISNKTGRNSYVDLNRLYL